jgi:hypothetical protein
MKATYKFEMSMDEDGNVEASFFNSKTLAQTGIKGKIILMEDEEVMHNTIKQAVQNAMTGLAFNGRMSNFSIHGNLGASK